MMDEGFVGLIFSVFNEDKNTKVRLLVIFFCFNPAQKKSWYENEKI